MEPYVTSVEHAGGYRLYVMFSDGVGGEVDLTRDLWGPAFEPLLDLDYFAKAQVDIELGTVVWPNGADFAPETLYSRLVGHAVG